MWWGYVVNIALSGFRIVTVVTVANEAYISKELGRCCASANVWLRIHWWLSGCVDAGSGQRCEDGVVAVGLAAFSLLTAARAIGI